MRRSITLPLALNEATYVRQAISVALRRSPETFDEFQRGHLLRVEKAIADQVDEVLGNVERAV